MDLEHPDITRTLRTGYPNKEKAPIEIGAEENTQVDYNTNKYIEIYEDQRDGGKDPLEAYSYASGKLAFDSDSDMYTLQNLYFHYVKDLSDDLDEILKEMRF